MRRFLVALTACLIAGCSAGEGVGETTGDRLSHRNVECGEVIDVVDDPGPSYRVHGSGEGFIALPAGETLQLGRSGPQDSGYEDYRFSKFGLPVRRLRQVTLEIVGAPDEALLRYGGGDSALVGALTFGPCGSNGGGWVVWAGGIWVNEPGCVELVAKSGGEEISVWLAVGASCDGMGTKS